MASITGPIDGLIACTFLHAIGPPKALKERITVWQLPGLDGYGAQRLGLGDAEFGFTAVLHGTEAAVDAWIAKIERLQSRIVSAFDDWLKTHTKLLVTRVEQPVKTPALSHIGAVRGEVNLFGVTHSQ